MENPPKKFFRLSPGKEVRLRYAYFITCKEVKKNAAGEVIELRCTYDPATKGGNAPDGRKVKATIHWVSAQDAVTAEVRLYNPLFTRPDPDAANFAAELNPQSLEVLPGRKLEPVLAGDNSGEPVQFERQGYFVRDRDSKPGHLVFSRTIGLRDSYAKAVAREARLAQRSGFRVAMSGSTSGCSCCKLPPSSGARGRPIMSERDRGRRPAAAARGARLWPTGTRSGAAAPGLLDELSRLAALGRRPHPRMARLRSRARAPRALDPDRLRLRGRALFHRRHRAGALGRRDRQPACAFDLHRRPRAAAGLAADDRRDGARRGLHARDLEDDADRASGARRARLWRDAVRLRRDPRGTRALRPHHHPHPLDLRRASRHEARARAGFGAQGHGARGRLLHRGCGRGCRRRSRRCGRAATTSRATIISSASARPASCSATSSRRRRRMPPDLSLRFAATIAGIRDAHRRAHPRGAAGRQGRHRLGADHRQARRHLRAGQRGDVCLEPRACAVDLRLSHGGRGRRRVLPGARRARADPGRREPLSDQEMGRARGA